MAVLKNKTQGNYTVVSQNIARDKDLSLTERGMLLTLLSLPDNWHLTIRGLSQILPDGKDKIANTLNSLIAKGYVTREQGRHGTGKFGTTDLEVHETPVNCERLAKDSGNAVRKNAKERDVSPCPEKPDTADPDTVDRYPENLPQYNTNRSNHHKEITHRVCKADTLSDEEYDDLVSEFGRETVEYQIRRITERGYQGCLNFETIRKWCGERLRRPSGSQKTTPRRNSFFNFEQRTDYDYDELEKLFAGG